MIETHIEERWEKVGERDVRKESDYGGRGERKRNLDAGKWVPGHRGPLQLSRWFQHPAKVEKHKTRRQELNTWSDFLLLEWNWNLFIPLLSILVCDPEGIPQSPPTSMVVLINYQKQRRLSIKVIFLFHKFSFPKEDHGVKARTLQSDNLLWFLALLPGQVTLLCASMSSVKWE